MGHCSGRVHVRPPLFMEQKMKRQKLTEQEKYEKDFKQFSLLTLRMIAQSHENPRQLRRLKSMFSFLGTEIKELEKKIDEK